MHHSFHEFDLSFHTLSPLRLYEFTLLIYLHSDFYVVSFIQAYSDNSVSTSSNNLSYNIVLKTCLRTKAVFISSSLGHWLTCIVSSSVLLRSSLSHIVNHYLLLLVFHLFLEVCHFHLLRLAKGI